MLCSKNSETTLIDNELFDELMSNCTGSWNGRHDNADAMKQR